MPLVAVNVDSLHYSAALEVVTDKQTNMGLHGEIISQQQSEVTDERGWKDVSV